MHQNKFYKKYAELMIKAQNTSKRNEAILLIKKVAKLKTKFKTFESINYQT